MKKQIYVNILLNASGNLLRPSLYDADLSDLCQHWKDTLGEELEPSEPGDSEYSYCAEENGADGIKGAAIDALHGGNQKIAEWAVSRWGNDSDIWWATLSDVQVSAFVPARKFLELLNFWFRDDECETLGTLGGPLGGVVPDIPYSAESRELIASIRATPVCCTGDQGDYAPMTSASWDRFRGLVRRVA